MDDRILYITVSVDDLWDIVAFMTQGIGKAETQGLQRLDKTFVTQERQSDFVGCDNRIRIPGLVSGPTITQLKTMSNYLKFSISLENPQLYHQYICIASDYFLGSTFTD